MLQSFRIPMVAVCAALLALALSSCVLTVDGANGASSSAVTSQPARVLLRIEGSGSTTSLDRVEYRVGGVARVDASPTLPWSGSVTGSGGDTIFFTAEASAARGSTVTMTYEVERGGRIVARGRRTCDQVGCPTFELRGTVPR